MTRRTDRYDSEYGENKWWTPIPIRDKKKTQWKLWSRHIALGFFFSFSCSPYEKWSSQSFWIYDNCSDRPQNAIESGAATWEVFIQQMLHTHTQVKAEREEREEKRVCVWERGREGKSESESKCHLVDGQQTQTDVQVRHHKNHRKIKNQWYLEEIMTHWDRQRQLCLRSLARMLPIRAIRIIH